MAEPIINYQLSTVNSKVDLKKYSSLQPPLIIVGVVLAYRLLYVELFVSFEGKGAPIPSVFDLPLLGLVSLAAFFAVKYLNLYLPYGKFSVLRFSFELLYLIISSAFVAIGYCISDIVDGHFSALINSGSLGITFLAVLLLNTVVLYLFNLRLYYRNRHRAVLAEQIAAKNQATYQYNQLKRQLDPHFLFNSLSVLDSLVDIDPVRAHSFIHKLSEVYRYLISCQEVKTVNISDEIKFVDSYISLMRERFGDSIQYTNNVDEHKSGNRFIIPFSLQILFENAIKHNAISAAAPLKITLFMSDNYLIVSNNINPKIGVAPASSGIGLRYITVRYLEFSNNEVVIENSNNIFTVKLPLLSDTLTFHDEHTYN